MKTVLITDTHGRIDLINQLAAEFRADACIHCGDVGFFDDISIRNLSSAELLKIIRHAPIPDGEKKSISSAPQSELADIVLQKKLAGTFPDYLTGKKSFSVPVYAVWGNHEDIRIVEQLRKNPLPNLTLLDEKTSVMLEGIRIYGIGGDFNAKHLTLAKKLGIPRVRGQIKSAFWQYEELAGNLDKYPAGERRIQITHCDPAETAFLEALAYRCGAFLTLSGHMHRKETRQWESVCSSGAGFEVCAAACPTLPWEKLHYTPDGRKLRHWNLAPSRPLLLEISGPTCRIKC